MLETIKMILMIYGAVCVLATLTFIVLVAYDRIKYGDNKKLNDELNKTDEELEKSGQ